MNLNPSPAGRVFCCIKGCFVEMEFSKKDKFYMQKALRLAKKGEGFTSPNPLVGAVVVKDGEIVGEGYHQYYGGPHAEVYALDEAGKMARGSTIYVTLEPCSHHGKTPPCSLKIINSGVKRVVAAMQDPNPEVAGRGFKMMKDKGIEVEVGLLEKEAKKLNEIFLKYITSDNPFIILKSAQTIDGYLATSTGNSKWVTGEKARLYGHQLRHKVDGILVGINTVLSDDPSLTARPENIVGKDPLRIILDSKLKTPKDAKIIIQNSEAKTLIVHGDQVNAAKKKFYEEKENVELLSLKINENGNIPLKRLLKKLHKRKISSILIEGGGKVNHSFLKEKLVDKFYNFIAPKYFGGNDGITVFDGDGPLKMEDAIKIKDYEMEKVGKDFLIKGYRKKEGDI